MSVAVGNVLTVVDGLGELNRHNSKVWSNQRLKGHCLHWFLVFFLTNFFLGVNQITKVHIVFEYLNLEGKWVFYCILQVSFL